MFVPRAVLVAVVIVILALCTRASAGPGHTVSVTVEGMGDKEFRALGALDLKERVVLRLVEDGFSVAPVEAEPAVRMVIRLEGRRLVILASGGERELTKDVSIDRPLASLHLEVVQKAAELASRIAEELPPPTVPSVVGAVPAPLPAQEIQRNPDTFDDPPPRRVTLGPAFAQVLRAGGSDPVLGIELRSAGRRLAWHVTPAVLFADTSAVSVNEWQVTVAIGLPIGHGSWQLEPMLQVGGLAHTFTLRSAAMMETSGTRFDGLALAAAELRWLALHPFELSVRLALGAASSRREHIVDDAVVWERGAFRGEAGVGLALRL